MISLSRLGDVDHRGDDAAERWRDCLDQFDQRVLFSIVGSVCKAIIERSTGTLNAALLAKGGVKSRGHRLVRLDQSVDRIMEGGRRRIADASAVPAAARVAAAERN